MDEVWPLGIFCEFGAGVVPLQGFLGLPEVRALDVWAVIEQDRLKVLRMMSSGIRIAPASKEIEVPVPRTASSR